ncbi:MAG: peptidase M42 [Clostridia bacterium]|nr:peptidase M42 [Clostridia bacterium]
MKFDVDIAFLVDCFKDIVSVPSPLGYGKMLDPVLDRYAERFGKKTFRDRRGTPYVLLEGEDPSKTVLVGAHSDTIGLVVRRIDTDGKLRVRALGGIVYSSLEGETVYIINREGKIFSGLMSCQKHSTHSFSGMAKEPRDEDTMLINIDERVSTKEEVLALGIRPGDPVSAEPHAVLTPSGFLKSRYIDDKAAVACVFTMLKYLCENSLKPKYNTLLAFPYCEENGLGGAYVPPEVSEYVAVDIIPTGPDTDCTEFTTAVCASDIIGPYDYDLTSRLLAYAEKAGCECTVELAKIYSTDAAAAMRSGNDLVGAAFGMPVFGSHGMERTHVDGLKNTVNLLLAYVLDI